MQVSILSPASHNGRLLPAPSPPAPNLHSNNPNLRPGSSAAPKKHPKCGLFSIRASLLVFSPLSTRVFLGTRVSSFGGAEVRSCGGGLGGILGQINGFVQFQIQLQRPRLPACFAAGPFTRVHHT